MTIIDHIADELRAMEIGQRYALSDNVLRDVPDRYMVGMMGPPWKPVDQIMERIIGSSYTIEVWRDEWALTTYFQKHKEGDRVFWESPDRREQRKEIRP